MSLQGVLNKAHSQHVYKYDCDQYQKKEHWELGLVGDCEDFALWCKSELKKEDVDADLIYCLVETGGGHLVCHVDGYILDNRHNWVMRQEDLPYKWLKIGRPNSKWYEIKTPS